MGSVLNTVWLTCFNCIRIVIGNQQRYASRDRVAAGHCAVIQQDNCFCRACIRRICRLGQIIKPLRPNTKYRCVFLNELRFNCHICGWKYCERIIIVIT